MADVKETLWRLVGEVQDCGCDVTEVVVMNYVENDVLIDHLITNGVTIPVRCKDCVSKVHDAVADEDWCNNPGGLCCQLKDDYFCPFGERRTDGT